MNIFFLGIVGFIVSFIASPVYAAEFAKLPYGAGARFIVTAGYNTPPTHIKKDAFALDFTQEGCRAYGVSVVAARSGTALMVAENGYNGGYGSQVLVRSSDGSIARYAHLLAGSSPIEQGDHIPRGAVIGAIGNTGMVAGAACAEHPGTHLHFAMYKEQADGSFAAQDPEPISDYTGVAVGMWYLSDNAVAVTKGNLTALIALVDHFFGTATTVIDPTETATDVAILQNEQSLPSPPVISSSSNERVPIKNKSVSVLSPIEISISLPTSSFSPVSSTSSSFPLSSLSSSPVSFSQGASSTPVFPINATSRLDMVPSGGGGSSGGVMMTLPLSSNSGSSVNGTSTGENNTGTSASFDDPTDDTVSACEANR